MVSYDGCGVDLWRHESVEEWHKWRDGRLAAEEGVAKEDPLPDAELR